MRRPFPRDWNTSPSLLTLYEKNSRFTFDHYRGIDIGSPTIKKIVSRILNKRALDFVKGRLSPSQTGFIRGCWGPLFTLAEAIKNLIAQNQKLALIAVDLKKAFDSVQHPCLWYRVHKFGIRGKLFISVRALYDEVYCSAQINGERTARFPVQHGVLQGDPLSTIFFFNLCQFFPKANTRPGNGSTMLFA